MEAARTDPKSREIRLALEALKQKQAQFHKKDMGMYGGMFAHSS